MNRITAWLLAALLSSVPAVAQQKYVTFWRLTENQLDIEEGGRANTIAVNPGNEEEAFVASDSGGLFRTRDRGLHWQHIPFKKLPVIYTQSVAYVDDHTLLVSAKADFKVKNGGGVWRSDNGGDDWTQVDLTFDGFAGRLSAYEISVLSTRGAVPVAVVGTSEGVFVSRDAGVSWKHSNVFASGDRTVFSVLITAGVPARIYAGGPSGVRLGTDTLEPWRSPILDPGANGGIRDLHAFGASMLSLSQVFVVNGWRELFRTDDSGSMWTLMPSAPTATGCQGSAFIKTARRSINTSEFLDLYFGNRCGMHRLSARVIGGANADFSGTWQAADTGGKNPRDLALYRELPRLLASTGGVHDTPDGGATWTLAGGGRSGGYNALQVTEIKGQRVDSSVDLYIGTQDNNLWSMNVWGNIYASHPAEGWGIDLQRKLEPNEQPQITFMASGNNRISGRHFAGAMDWYDVASLHLVSVPTLVRRPFYVQLQRTPGRDPGMLLFDENFGWRDLAHFPEDPRDYPRLGRSDGGDTTQAAILYQPFRSNLLEPHYHWASRLMRIRKRLVPQDTATVYYPAMNDFGGLGINPTMPSAWYSVLAIDPNDSNHIIAPDVVNQYMMETRDAAEDWTLVHGLTELVTDNGNLLFRTDLGTVGPVCPIVTAISFSSQDPNLVLAGTSEGGIFISHDNGVSWAKIEGTEEATAITGFYWANANTVFVSTFGRGVWKLANVRIAVPGAFDDLCTSCEVVANDGSSGPVGFDGSLIVFEGSLLGVRSENGVLREAYVTPGSSVVFTGDQKDSQEDIVITESDGRDLKSDPLPKGPDGWIATGVVFKTGDALIGTAFAQEPISLVPPRRDEEVKGSTESPTKGTPYIRLTSSAFNGVPTAAPQEKVELSATDFVPGISYEVLVDGVAVERDVTADSSGAFTTAIGAPMDEGYHTVTVRRGGDETVIDASPFLVRSPD